MQHLGEELEGVRVVHLQLELQRVEHSLLQVLNRLDIEQAGPICESGQKRVRGRLKTFKCLWLSSRLHGHVSCEWYPYLLV